MFLNKKAKTKHLPSHIGNALIPPVAFAAVPNSPQRLPAIDPANREFRLSNSILSASLLGRMFASPTPPPSDGSSEHPSLQNEIDGVEDGYDPVNMRPSRSSKLQSYGESGLYESIVPHSVQFNLQTAPPRIPSRTSIEDDDGKDHVFSKPMKSMKRQQTEEQEAVSPNPRYQFPEAHGLQGTPISTPRQVTTPRMVTPRKSRELNAERVKVPTAWDEGCIEVEEEVIHIQSSPSQHSMPNEEVIQIRSSPSQHSMPNEEVIQIRSSPSQHSMPRSQGPNPQDKRLSAAHLDTVSPRKSDYVEVGSPAHLESQSRQKSDEVTVSTPLDVPDGQNVRAAIQMREEIEALRETVRRLSAELSGVNVTRARYPDESRMPGRGPIPNWIISTRYLCPLFSVYDQRIAEKDAMIKEYERELKDFETTAKDIVNENERLHIKLEECAVVNEATSRSDWQQFVEQAKLVLEENCLLIEQMRIQQEKAKEMQKTHLIEVARLSKQVIALEGDKNETENHLFRLRHQMSGNQEGGDFQRIKESTDLERVKEIYSRETIVTESRKREDEVSDIISRLESTQSERKSLAEELVDSKSAQKKLAIEIKSLKKSLRESHHKNEMLRKLLKQEITVEDYLDSVLKTANGIAHERDTYSQAVLRMDQLYGEKVSRLVDCIRANTTIDLSGKKRKPLSQMKFALKSLLEQNKDLVAKCKGHEREVHYLQALLKEKDLLIETVRSEKRTLEEKLTDLWHSAVDRDDSHQEESITT